MQAFHEANACGTSYGMESCASTQSVRTAQGLQLSGLQPLPDVTAEDTVIVPGFVLQAMEIPREVVRWIRKAAEEAAHICSVCTGTFVLGEAGLLDGRECTTHWKRVRELQERYPRARVLSDRLFVTDGNITSSAGIVSGIDMSLALIEQHYGPLMTARAAREMVVYLRRDGHQRQESVFLDYRTHLNSGVHDVQDYISGHAEKKTPIEELATMARMSPRNLTRTFRAATGLSIAEYRTKVRLELAAKLMNDPDLNLEAVAERCGFDDARHLRRLWKETYGMSPSQSRAHHRA
jgi:transcriptional regulator GlxA family with amidase domain